MKLKSFGCSFIFGSDLPDAGYRLEHYSKLTWPALLAQKFDWDYECYAKAGQGNLFIARQILSQIQTLSEPSIFLINWTWIDRLDYVSNVNDNDWRAVSVNQWQAIRPGSKTPESVHYYKNVHSQYRDKLTSLMQMYVCIQELERRQIPYISCAMDDLCWEDQWHRDNAMTLMQNYLRSRVTNFEGKNFIAWAQSQGYKTTDNNHLSVEGNQACADYLELQLRINKIQTIVGVPLESVQA